MRVSVCIRLSTCLFQLFSYRPGCHLLLCIVCTTSTTSKWTVPARTYLKINAVLDVAKKCIILWCLTLFGAHLYTQTSTHRSNISYNTVTKSCVSHWSLNSDSVSTVLLLKRIYSRLYMASRFIIFHRSSCAVWQLYALSTTSHQRGKAGEYTHAPHTSLKFHCKRMNFLDDCIACICSYNESLGFNPLSFHSIFGKMNRKRRKFSVKLTQIAKMLSKMNKIFSGMNKNDPKIHWNE